MTKQVRRLQDVISELSKCAQNFKHTVKTCLSTLTELEIFLKTKFKSHPDESVVHRVLRVYFRKTILQCRYIAAQYFRTDLYWGNLYSVSLAIISRMTDNKAMINFVQNLDMNTSTHIKSESNLKNWFFVKRNLDLSEYLNYYINEPLRIKLEEQLMMWKRKKWQDWGQSLTENLGKAHIICKLCGESILLMYITEHTKYCFASYEARQRVEAIDQELWEFHRMLLIEIKKTKFEVISQYQKISKRLRRQVTTIKLTRKKTGIPKQNFMEPISLINIIMDDFRNKSFFIDYFPNYPTSLMELHHLANKYEGLRFQRKKSKFASAAVRGFIFELSEGDSEGSVEEAPISPCQSPHLPCFMSLVEDRKSCLSAITRSSVAPRICLPLFKESLTDDQVQLYKKSLPKLTIFSALGIMPKLKDESGSLASFNKFFGRASLFSKLRKQQKVANRLGDVVKRSAEFRIEDCKLKEKLKKHLMSIRDIEPGDCKIDIARIKELINLKITLLCVFEAKFEGVSTKLGTSKFRMKTKSMDLDIKKESLEDQNVYFGTGKQRVKVLRESIKTQVKKILDLALPLYQLHARVASPLAPREPPAEDREKDELVAFVAAQFAQAQAAHESSIIRSQTLINSSDLSAFRLSLLSSLYNADFSDSGCNFIEEMTDHLFFSEDEDSKNRSRTAGKTVDRLDDMASYNFIKILGKGGYGVVWLVRRRLTGDLYAMKITDFGKNVG